jgi:hypothetical protein
MTNLTERIDNLISKVRGIKKRLPAKVSICRTPEEAERAETDYAKNRRMYSRHVIITRKDCRKRKGDTNEKTSSD